jgi:hypothetical protein
VHSEVEIRRWVESDYQAAAAVITAAYRGHVDAQINDQYHTLSGSLRFLNNIVRFPGCGLFDAESSHVALDRKAKSLIGLILCSRVRNDVGHVTQICILPEYRSPRHWRSFAGRHGRGTQETKFLVALADGDRGQLPGSGALSPAEFRYEENL